MGTVNTRLRELFFLVFESTCGFSTAGSYAWLSVRLYGLDQKQGSQHQGKTWKMVKAFSRPGKIREFEKRAKIRGKSGNLKIPSGKNQGKKYTARHMRFILWWAVHGYCPIFGGESVAVRGGMEATCKNKNYVFNGSWVMFASHQCWKALENSGKSGKNQGIWSRKPNGNPAKITLHNNPYIVGIAYGQTEIWDRFYYPDSLIPQQEVNEATWRWSEHTCHWLLNLQLAKAGLETCNLHRLVTCRLPSLIEMLNLVTISRTVYKIWIFV